MNRFVVTIGPAHSAPRYLDRTDVAELPFTPRSHRRWSSSTGSVHFAAWCREAIPTTWVIADHLQVAFGHGRAIGDTVDDAFAVVEIGRDGSGIIQRDPLGMHGLYVANCTDAAGSVLTVVGNRADLVAQTSAEITRRPPRRSLRCAGWMAFAGYPMDSTTGFDDVDALAQDSAIRIRADGHADVTTQAPVWERDRSAPFTDPGELADLLGAHIEASLRHAIDESGSERPRIQLTGGKDSRVVAAVAHASGLLPAFDLVTFGPSQLPDQVVAATVAAQLGAHHLDITHEHLEAAVEIGDDARLRRHVHRSSGRSFLGDANEPSRATMMTISGMFGEMYRTGREFETRDDSETLEATTRRFSRRIRLGNLRLVRDDVADELRAGLIDGFLEPADRVRRPEDLHQCHFIRRRIPGWQAPLVEHHERRLHAFYSPACIRTSFAVGGWARAREIAHRTLIERAGLGLIDVPLHGSTWWGSEPDSAPPTKQTAAAPASFKQIDEGQRTDPLQSFVHELAADDHNPAWEVIDRDRFRTAATALSGAKVNERRQILGAAAALIWHGQGEQASR